MSNGPGRGGPIYRSVPARCMAGRWPCSSSDEVVLREIAEARMRAYLVEVSPPFFDQNFCLGARTKPFEAQTLVAELAVEALRDAILPRLAGFDQCRADALRDDPRQQCLRHELGPVVATQKPRGAARAHQADNTLMGRPPRIPSPVANSAPYDSISARAAEAPSSLSRNAALPSTLRGSVGWWSARGRPQAWV